MSHINKDDPSSKDSLSELEKLLKAIFLMGKDGYHYAVLKDKSNPYAVRINSRVFRNFAIKELAAQGRSTKPRDVADIIDQCKAIAEGSGAARDFLSRVAPNGNRIIIDSGNSDNTHFAVSEDGVEIIYENSPYTFARSGIVVDTPLPVLGDKANLKKIGWYLNLSKPDELLLIAWISYVLAHPKVEATKYPLLVLAGSQGQGKSFTSNLILKLTDPTNFGLRVMPNTPKDLAIMTNSNHVVAFDNLRSITDTQSDLLCMASTRGNYTGRQLFTDADTSSIRLHAPVILNGIHQLISQPDLAQRSIQLNLKPIDPKSRKSEADMFAKLEQDFPYIFGGLLEYIAAIFAAMPNAQVVDAERMIDFSKWLAAMEVVDQVPVGTYQSLYSSVVEEGQLDVLQGSLLGDAMYAFGMKQQVRPWTGTPAQLLTALNASANTDIMRSPDWPRNPISLSKKMAGIKAPLEALGVLVNFTRGKERTYTVGLKEGISDAY